MSTLPDSLDAAEKGESPTLSNAPTLGPRPSTTRSETILSRSQSSIAAFGTRTLSIATQAAAAVTPNFSKAKAHCRTSRLEDFPLGYPRVSWFLNSDDSFMMYRKFGQLHSRLLLYKQDEIRRLEQELCGLDFLDSELEQNQRFIQCHEKEESRSEHLGDRPRGEVITDIEKKLLEYGTLLKQAQELQAMNRPSDRDHASVSNYICNEQPFVESDRQWIEHKEDLVSIRPGREHAWLDNAVETALRWYPCEPVKYLFCDEETREKTTDGTIHYFTRSRISFFVTFLITFLILALLVVPIYILYWLTVDLKTSAADTICIGVLLIATLIFSCMLSTFTKAKRHEILAAAAGYCAVLVVFLGNVGNVGQSNSPS